MILQTKELNYLILNLNYFDFNMTTTEAFKELLKRKDILERTSMSNTTCSKYKAYFFSRKSDKRCPKVSTMEKYLSEYGYKKKPETWVLK